MKCRLLLLALMIILIFGGCNANKRLSDDESGIYEKIHHYYNKMESYSAKVVLTVKGNRGDNVYELEQKVLKNDKMLSCVLSPDDVKGIQTIKNGEKVKVIYNGKEKHELESEASADLDLSYVNNFFSLYYRSEETSVSVSANVEKGGTTLLETDLSDKSTRRQKASMLIDNNTLTPKNITVYDMGGNVVFIAEFVEFKYNDKIDDKIFEI
ncbi:MAG: hypothetical protein II978_04895 [Clostridia bacterium]|nr:hypothetical protein [Clostridia bacterium]